MFESFSYYGNNLYLDNVLITNSVSINQASSDNLMLSIIPNPSSGIFTISANNIFGTVNMEIINSQGQVVMSQTMANLTGTLEKQIILRNHAKGIYFLKMNTSNGVDIKKILLK